MGTAAGRAEESWAVTEFAEAELGDARRTQRREHPKPWHRGCGETRFECCDV